MRDGADLAVGFELELEVQLRLLAEPREVMALAAQRLGEYLQADRCGYAEIDPGGVWCNVECDWTRPPMPSLAGRHRLADFGPPLIERLRAGEAVCLDEVRDHPLLAGEAVQRAFEAVSTRAAITVPLVKQGRMSAALYLHQAGPRHWSAAQAALVARVAERTWSAVARARAEASLRASEARFRAAVGAVDGVVWTNDATGRMTGEQPGWSALTGQTEEEYRGYGWSRAVHPDDAQPTVDAWQRAVEQRGPFVFEHRLRCHDGQWRIFSIRARPVLDDAGEIVEWVGVHTDITAQRQVEQRLRELNETLEAEVAQRTRDRDQLWRLSADLMLAVRANGEILAVNPAWTQILGWTERELVGTSLGALMHPDDLENANAAARELIRDAGQPRVACRCRHRDGSWREIEWSSVHERGVIHSVGRDVTAEKQARASYERAQARLRTIFETSLQLQGLLGIDGTLLDVNATALAAFGCSFDAVAGQRLWELPWLADTPGLPQGVRSAVETAAAGASVRQELSIAFDGGIRSFDFSLRPIDAGDGAPMALVLEATDITERRRAEEALRQSQKLDAMGQLTGGVAHDFNNLLTPIIISLDLLERRAGDDELERKLIRNSLSAAERAKTLVQRLLAFARRQPMQVGAVDVQRLLGGIAELIRSTIGPRIALELDIAPQLPAARADHNQLEMAILNLAVNSRDAMPDGGRLTIRAVPDSIGPGHRSGLPAGRYLRLSVADSGCGMDEATLARAIEPFFSTKGVGKGTGLGLSMVHGVASQLGGALRIDSAPGKGTEVELWLPLEAGGADAAAAVPIALPSDVDELPVRGSVLLVDDDELVRASTAALLEEIGYAVHPAGDASAALRMLDDGLRVSAVVTDHLMPGMTGVALARELRSRNNLIPVVIISGYAALEDIAPDLPRLTKPFSQRQLAQMLAGVIRDRARADVSAQAGPANGALSRP